MQFNRMRGGRQRMRRMVAPIISFRQIRDIGISLIAGANQVDNISTANAGIDTGNLNTAVSVGCKIYRIRVVINARGTGGADSGDLSWYLAKARNGQDAASDFPAPNAIGGDEVRNQIFRTEYDSYGSNDGYRYKFDRWVKIPKIYQRMRAGDNLFIRFFNDSGSAVQYKLHTDYKCYT